MLHIKHVTWHNGITMPDDTSDEKRYPLEREVESFSRLSGEHNEMIESVRKNVMKAVDVRTAKNEASLINEIFVADGLMGRTAQLSTTLSQVISRDLDFNTGNVSKTLEPEVFAGRTYVGMFAGCDVISYADGRNELVYVVELPVQVETMRFKTVASPVETATLTVDVPPELSLIDSEKMAAAITQLVRIDSFEVQEALQDIMKMIQHTDEITAEFLAELSLHMIRIMGDPAVKGDKDSYNALANIIIELLDDEALYTVHGLEFKPRKPGKKHAVSLKETKFSGEVHAIVMISNLEFSADIDGSGPGWVIQSNMQPAILMLDEKYRERVVPLSHLYSFEVEDFDKACESSRLRFIEQNPDTLRQN